MAWGAPRGIDDLVERVGRNDPALTSLCVLRMRRVDEDGCRRLAEALAGACHDACRSLGGWVIVAQGRTTSYVRMCQSWHAGLLRT